jgi:hypothetical protein
VELNMRTHDSVRRTLRSLLLVALAVSHATGVAVASTIDFETLPGGAASDGIPIGTQYLATHRMAFGLDTNGDGFANTGALPLLEQVGEDEYWAFVNDIDSASEKAMPGYEAMLGGWTLALPTHRPGTALLVSYATPMSAAGADIWDIDGNPRQGTERWRIDALAFDGSVLASILSPSGDSLGAESLNAMPWHFAFTRETADIFGIRIEFVGSKTWGIGAGFDRFWCAVPEPGTLSLLALGVAVLGAPRRRPAA